jgi:hypothetical protein
VKFEARAEVDWPARAAEDVRFKLDLDPGHVAVGSRELDLPRMEAVVSGRVAAGFPESEAQIAVNVKAAFPQATIAMDSEASWDGKSGRLRVNSHSTPFDTGLFLEYLPRLPAGTALSLPVSWMIEADVDTKAGLVRQAKAALELGAGRLTMPEYLRAPLAIDPCRFAVEIQDQGATGKIAPYDWKVGPLNFHSDGGGWARTGDRIEGGFSFGLGRVKIADGIALLSQKLRAQLPAELAEIGDLAVAGFDWHERLTGAWKDGQAVFDQTVADGRLNLAVGTEPLSLLLHLEMPVPPRSAHIEVTIPDFVQARWQLPLLDRLPVPLLDAPARARFTADWEFPVTLKSARWRVEAGAGRILPRGLLANWLGKPLPLTRLAVGGSVGAGFSRFEVDEFSLESGRASCRFDQFAVKLASEADRRRLHVGGRLVFDNWFAEDFIPLLTLPARDRLPGQGTTLLDLGLETFTASLDADVSIDLSGKMAIESMKHDGSCVLRVGDQPLPLKTAAGFDPLAHQVFVRAEIAGLRPTQFQPKLARDLPVALSVLDFPLDLRLEARSAVPADFPNSQPLPPEVAVTIRGGLGTIRRCTYLEADTPLRSLELEAVASVGDQTLKSFRGRADLGGPVVGIDSLHARLGETLTAELVANVADLPLDWLLARVPGGQLPPDVFALLPKLAVGGVVRRLQVAAEARGATGKAAGPELVALRVDGEMEKPFVHLKDWPAVAVGRVQIAGDLQAIRVDATDVQTGPLQISKLEITASQILGTNPAVAGRLVAATHLAELPGFLRSLPVPVVLPEALDWSKLAGSMTTEIAYAGDLTSLPALTAALSGAMKFKVDGFVMPALPGRFETAPGSCEGSLKIKNGAVELEGSLATDLRKGFEVVEGPVQALFTVSAKPGGKAEASLKLDFKDASLHLPGGLAWQKAPGSEASLQVKVAVADYHFAGGAASATFDLAGKGLVYGQLGLTGHIDAKLNPEGRPGAFKLVCDTIQADETSLRLEADGVWPQSLDARLTGARLDLRPLVHLTAPEFAALNAPASPEPQKSGTAAAKPEAQKSRTKPAPTKESGAVTPTTAAVPGPSSPGSPEPAGAAGSFVPADTKVQVALQEVVLGGGRTIAPLALTAQLHGARPVSGDLAFSSMDHGVRATLLPAPIRSNWSVKIDDFADLLTVGTALFHELPASMTAADTTIGGLMGLPERFIGGRVTANGILNFDDASDMVEGHLQVGDLRLRTEIPFLSSIAALVKQTVKIRIPFKEFRIDSFSLGPKGIHLKDAFLDGPINLTAEEFDYNFADTELYLLGKVFGVWFEVKGPRDHLERYLSDKNKVLKLITTENEFEWESR